MKIFGLILTIFMSGYACGALVVNKAEAQEQMCAPSYDEQSTKEKIIAFEPLQTCPQYNPEVTLDQNLRFCGRTKLRLHNI